MLQISPQTKILVAVQPVDFRKGIDGLVQLCQAALKENAFSGGVFVFCNRRRTALKALAYDGQGFWLCHKRLSEGRFRWWPAGVGVAAQALTPCQLQVLFSAGNPAATEAAPAWRPVTSAV